MVGVATGGLVGGLWVRATASECLFLCLERGFVL